MVVAVENFSRSNVERRLEMKRFDGKRWIVAGLAGMIAAAMSITSFAENGWTRVSPRSAWDGTYYRSDGQRVTVTDTDQDYVYISFTMDGESAVDALKFTDETRTRAETLEVHEIPAIWTLSEDMLYVDASASCNQFFHGVYRKKADASCWVRQKDGSYIYLDENGQILKNHMTPDGFYVGPNGKWAAQIGMCMITPGRYKSMFQNPDAILYENWSFSMYTSGDTDRPLTGPEDRIEVGCADYEAYDQKADFLYTKTDLRLFNTMEGYVIEDAGGEVFAWMYPTIHGNDLMVQMYGTEQYHTIRMVEDYSESGG